MNSLVNTDKTPLPDFLKSPVAHPQEVGTFALDGFGQLAKGEITMDEPYQIRVFGRISSGEGSIDGKDCDENSFKSTLYFISTEALASLHHINAALRAEGKPVYRGMFDIPGNCMDGRRDLLTFAGGKVIVSRPKVVGGPTLFLTNVLSVAGLFDPKTSMIDRFRQCADTFPRAASMHVACGMAAQGSVPVLVNYHDKFDEIQDYTAMITDNNFRANNLQRDMILRGLNNTISAASVQTDTYNEHQMIEVVRGTTGDDAILELAIDHDDPNHGHSEKGLVYLLTAENLIIVNDKVVTNPNLPDVFYHNAGYAKKLIKNAVGLFDQERLMLAQLLGLQLPLAATMTLGKNQWLGTVGDYKKMIDYLYVA